MLTRSSERIFNPMRYTGLNVFQVLYNIEQATRIILRKKIYISMTRQVSWIPASFFLIKSDGGLLPIFSMFLISLLVSWLNKYKIFANFLFLFNQQTRRLIRNVDENIEKKWINCQLFNEIINYQLPIIVFNETCLNIIYLYTHA